MPTWIFSDYLCTDYHFDSIKFLVSILEIFILREYLKLLNRLYDITWFGSVHA